MRDPCAAAPAQAALDPLAQWYPAPAEPCARFSQVALQGDFEGPALREGQLFTALCSTDGVHWLTCGPVDFPARDRLRVGIASLRGVVAHFKGVRVLTKP